MKLREGPGEGEIPSKTYAIPNPTTKKTPFKTTHARNKNRPQTDPNDTRHQ